MIARGKSSCRTLGRVGGFDDRVGVGITAKLPEKPSGTRSLSALASAITMEAEGHKDVDAEHTAAHSEVASRRAAGEAHEAGRHSEGSAGCPNSLPRVWLTGPHDFHEFDLDARLQEYACSGLERGRLFADEDCVIEKGEELWVNLLPG
jgi:hypothetical protein